MQNKHFNLIRFLAETGITALGALYKGVAEVWGLPFGEAVLTTCVLLSTFVGVWTEYLRTQHNEQFDIIYAPKNQPAEDATPIPEVLNATIEREDIE